MTLVGALNQAYLKYGVVSEQHNPGNGVLTGYIRPLGGRRDNGAAAVVPRARTYLY